MSNNNVLNLKILPPIGSSPNTPLSEKIAYISLFNRYGPNYYLIEASKCSEPFEDTHFYDYEFLVIEHHNKKQSVTLYLSDIYPPAISIDHTFKPCKVSEI